MNEATLKEPVTVTSEYKAGHCHFIYGKVVISATPADAFSFESEAVWPDANYDALVRRGITDVLEEAGLGASFGAAFTLEEIGWHEIDSCEAGYHRAAKQAAGEILKTVGAESALTPDARV
jgi:hypothetical protein